MIRLDTDHAARVLAFLEGFEDDELQEGMAELIGPLRAQLEIGREARRIGGGTANLYLAALLIDVQNRAEAGEPLNALDLAALNEAQERIAENAVNDDAGDYYGPDGAPDPEA